MPLRACRQRCCGRVLCSQLFLACALQRSNLPATSVCGPGGLIPTGFLGVAGVNVHRSIPEQAASRGVGLLFWCSLLLSTQSGTFLGRTRLFFLTAASPMLAVCWGETKP